MFIIPLYAYPLHRFWKNFILRFLETVVVSSILLSYFELTMVYIKIFDRYQYLLIALAESKNLFYDYWPQIFANASITLI